MDVRCPKCQAEYELDDTRVADDGVTVKCSECQHVFRVKKKSLVMTLPVREEIASATPSSLPPTAQHREWKVRQPNGNVYLCRELTTLQKWIVEGKVGRDDEISLTGDTWKRLGNIPELASFFQVVEDAAKARAYEAMRSSGPPPPPAPSIPPGAKITDTWRDPNFALPPPNPPPPAAEPSVPPGAKLTDTWKQANFSVPPPAPPPSVPPQPDPLKQTQKVLPPAPPDPAPPRATSKSSGRLSAASTLPDDAELVRAVKGGGSSRWVALILGGLLVGGGAGYYFGFYEPEQQVNAEATKLAAQRAAEEAARAKAEAEVLAKAEAEAEARRREAEAAAAALLDSGIDDAGTTAAGRPDAGVADAGAPDAGVVVEPGSAPKTVDAGVKGTGVASAPVGRSYDFYMERGDALRDAEKPSQALSFYGRAADLKPDRVEPVVGRGFALFDMGQMLQAEASFEQALRLNGKYGPASWAWPRCSRRKARRRRPSSSTSATSTSTPRAVKRTSRETPSSASNSRQRCAR
jgi:predicted Zn finger-like uncharacterized protein